MFIKQFKLLLFITYILFSSILYADNIWRENKNVEGIRVFTRDIEGSSLKAFRGVISIPARLSSIVAVIDDTQVYSQLFHNTKNARNLMRVSENESYKYMITTLPWPATSRDSIFHSVLRQDKKSRVIQIMVNGVPKYIPSKPGLVRIQKMTGRWLLVPEKSASGRESIKVLYEMNVDPGGDLPSWLVNNMAVDLPFITLKNLRNLVKRARYQNIDRSFIID